MTVYVDDVRHRYGRMVMCHMWADTPDELLAMADRIGVARRWLQRPPKASWLHFDVSLGAKAKALAAGAVLTDKYGPVEYLARLDVASGNLERMERGSEKLASIARCRTLFSPPASEAREARAVEAAGEAAPAIPEVHRE